MITITEVTDINESIVKAFELLIPQLSTSVKVPTREQLNRVANSDNTRLLMAQDCRGYYIGTLTLTWYYTPTGCHAWIEDVVVDGEHQGKGGGRLLVQKAIEIATNNGAKKISLTSNPSRLSAHRLYEELAFDKSNSILRVLNLDTQK